MKKCVFLFYVLCSISSYGQENLVKDLDGDKTPDTVFLDVTSSKIVCKLSSSKSETIASREIEFLGNQNGIRQTKSGFELWSSFMRSGQSCQFRYDLTSKKIQLIGMSIYALGNGANDGSGEGSVNLLTNRYIGEWNYYSETRQKLVKLSTIKEKMSFDKTYLEKFDGKILDDFSARSSELYYKHKKLDIK
jgi:hypothetical protein